MLIDSHCHINFNAYKEDAEEVIQRSLANDIWMINIGSQYSTSARTIKIAEEYPEGVYAVVGLHPIHLTQDITESATFNGKKYDFTTKQEKFDYGKYKELALSSAKVVGLGETGLDYYYFDEMDMDNEEIKNRQKEVLKGFIKLAEELNLPLVFHCRGSKDDPYGAYDDMLDMLSYKLQVTSYKLKGVIHCFGGSREQAKKFLDLGFYLGFTGIITFKKSEELREVVKEIPLEKILIETDAPFLAPEPYRGKRNEPAYVQYVGQRIAEIKGISPELVARQTCDNTRKLFNF